MAEEIEKRLASLRSRLEAEDKRNNYLAHRFDRYVATCVYGSMLFGALAVGAGIISSKLISVPPWLISIFAAVGTGATVVAREAQFRAKANWFYSVRDTARDILWKLEYELPNPVQLPDIEKLSVEWRTRRKELGIRMEAITTQRDIEKKKNQ